MLVYNVVHRRVKTISDRHYRALFGQAPQPQEPQKVDGAAFGAMAEGRKREVERLKEAISGGKAGYSLYQEVEEELTFLCLYANKSAKSYLGRGT